MNAEMRMLDKRRCNMFLKSEHTYNLFCLSDIFIELFCFRLPLICREFRVELLRSMPAMGACNADAVRLPIGRVDKDANVLDTEVAAVQYDAS